MLKTCVNSWLQRTRQCWGSLIVCIYTVLWTYPLPQVCAKRSSLAGILVAAQQNLMTSPSIFNLELVAGSASLVFVSYRPLYACTWHSWLHTVCSLMAFWPNTSSLGASKAWICILGGLRWVDHDVAAVERDVAFLHLVRTSYLLHITLCHSHGHHLQVWGLL